MTDKQDREVRRRAWRWLDESGACLAGDLCGGWWWGVPVAVPEELRDLLDGLAQYAVRDDDGEPTSYIRDALGIVRSRDRAHIGAITGKSRYCDIEDCPGEMREVEWEDGTIGWVCTQDMEEQDDGSWALIDCEETGA
jgi:hypothetical protein